MKRGIVLIIVLTFLCGSLFSTAAAQQAETKSPRMSEKYPVVTEDQQQADQEQTEDQGQAGQQEDQLDAELPEQQAGQQDAEQEDQQEGQSRETAEDGGQVKQAISEMLSSDHDEELRFFNTETVLLKWEKFSADPVSYAVSQYNSAKPDLQLYFKVVNNTDKIMDLWLEDVFVNGIKVLGTGIYDIAPGTDNKDDPQDDIWILPRSENAEEGSQAILNPQTLQGTLVLKDSDSGEKLCIQEITIDFSTLEGEYNDYRVDTSPSKDNDPASGNGSDDTYEPDYIPAPSYHTLRQGDTGEDVRKMQEKLIELGYLYDYADGNFGPKTAAAVKDFNEANGLDGGTVADYTMQNLLFSGLAETYTEPWIPLEIGAYFEWDPIPTVNTFFFRVQVINHSRTRTIKGYELSVYYTDVWGNKLDGGNVYTQTMTQSVSPGEILYSANFNLGNWYSVDTVWVGISRIVFDDGEIRDNDNITYYSCVVPSRIEQ